MLESKKHDQTSLMTPVFPAMPSIFADAMPVEIPQLQWGTSLIGGFIHNWHLRQQVTEKKRQSEIACYQNETVKAKLDTIESMLTFGDRVKLSYERIASERRIMQIDEEKRKEELNELRLKNQQLFYEVEISRMDFEARKRAMEEEYGTTETKNRS